MSVGGDVVKRKILVVEDDEVFRATITEILSEKYSVYQAADGRSACELLSLQTVDLVLSDVQMPRMTGVELLEWCKKNNKNVPFIIMTGFSTLLETQSAYDLGAKGFVAKPFNLAQLLKMIPEAMGLDDKPTAPATKTIADFYKVSIDEFVSKPVIDFDIYIRLSDTKFVKIANKNEELPKAQLNQYNSRGVKYFYIEKADFSKLVQFNLDLAKVINNHKKIPADKKMAFMKYTGDIILERTFTDGVNPESLKDADSFLKLTLESVTSSDTGFELLSILNGYSDKLYADALATSLYSVLVAKQMDIRSNVTLFKISMAGLFLDIGKKELDPELMNIPRHVVSKDQRKQIESHVVRGQEILMSVKNLHSDIVRMVYEHHEDQIGQGYPNAKTAREQHPLSRITQCVNLFIENIQFVRDDKGKIEPLSIIEHIKNIYGARVDPAALAALQKVFSNASKAS